MRYIEWELESLLKISIDLLLLKNVLMYLFYRVGLIGCISDTLTLSEGRVKRKAWCPVELIDWYDSRADVESCIS